LRIADWPEGERPRERLLAQGAGALTDAELIALCLRTGMRGRSAVDLGRDLVARHGGLAGLLSAGHRDLASIQGMGPAKAAILAAILELARRAPSMLPHAEQVARLAVRLFDLTAPGAVRDYLRLTLGSRPREAFLCLFLDAQHRVTGIEELFRGTLSQTSVYPREVVKAALAANAAAVIFAHNHPSGVAQPSQADELLTRQLKEALALVDVRVLDHFIVAGNQALSFAERGLL